MLTEIEQFLFQEDTSAHFVVEIRLSEKRLVLIIAPSRSLFEGKTNGQQASNITAQFDDVLITSVDTSYCEQEELNLPWDIIGFDSYRQSDGKWRFVLHTEGIEYGFEARWPSLLPGAMLPS